MDGPGLRGSLPCCWSLVPLWPAAVINFTVLSSWVGGGAMRLFNKVCVFQIPWNGERERVCLRSLSSLLPVPLRVLYPCVRKLCACTRAGAAAAAAAAPTRRRAWIKAEGRAEREPEKNNLQLKANSFKVMNPPG